MIPAHHGPAAHPRRRVGAGALFTVAALAAAALSGCGGGANSSSSAAAALGRSSSAPVGATSTTVPAKGASVKTEAPAAPSPHAFAAGQIAPSAASSLARSGAIVLPVAIGGPGRITAFGQAQILGVGIIHVATARPATATRAGIVDLTLELTPLARRQLAAGRSIDMFVAVSFSKGEVIQREEVHLKP